MLFLLSAMSGVSAAEDDVDELARKVSNPASFMISVPVHSDFDIGRWGGDDTYSATLDIEPVIPFALNDDWNMISHTDFPIVYNDPIGTPGENWGSGISVRTSPSHPRGMDRLYGPLDRNSPFRRPRTTVSEPENCR